MSLFVRLALLSSVLALGVALAVWPGAAGAGGAPANDDFPGTAITALPFEVTLDTSAATAEVDEPVSFCAYEATNTVWWSFTATETQVMAASAVGADHPPVLAVWETSGFGGGGLTEVRCDGNPGFTGSPEAPDFPGYPPVLGISVWFAAEAGKTYYFQVGGYDESFFPFGAAGLGYPPGGPVTFLFEALTVPPNDHFADAEVVHDLPISYKTNITAATIETDEPQPSCLLGSFNEQPVSTVWYAYMAEADAELLIDGWYSDMLMFSAVWTGQAAVFEEVACSVNVGTVEVKAGTTYYIQVGEVVDDFFPPTGGIVRLLFDEWVRPNCPASVQEFPDAEGDTLGQGAFQPDFASMSVSYSADHVCLTFEFHNDIHIGGDVAYFSPLVLGMDLDNNAATGFDAGQGGEHPCVSPGELGVEASLVVFNDGESNPAVVYIWGVIPMGGAGAPLAAVTYGDNSISVGLPLGPLGGADFTVLAEIGADELADCIPNEGGGVRLMGPSVVRFGDVNCSGQVNESDVRDLLLFASGLYDGAPGGCTPIGEPLDLTYPVSGQVLIAGDVNCDANVDALDALALLLHLAGLGEDVSLCPTPGTPPVQ